MTRQSSGICRQNKGVKGTDKWYADVPESVLENENYELLWYLNMRTDMTLILARKLDLVMLAREMVKLLNYRCRKTPKEDEKIEEYQHLARDVRTRVAPALKTEPLRSKGNMKGLRLDTKTAFI